MADTILGTQSFASEEVYQVKWCPRSPDLLAVGTSNTLQILRLGPDYTPSVLKVIRPGTRVTHISWGPTFFSEDESNQVLRLELLVACADQSLRLVTYETETADAPERSSIKTFGQGHSGHAGRITSVAWCSVPGYANVIASAASDNCCLIWNTDCGPNETATPAPTLVGPLRFTPLSISFHPTSSSRLMVYDSTGTLKLIDWTKPSRPIVISLHEPRTLIRKLNSPGELERFGMAEWKTDEPDVFGAVKGNRWFAWDLRLTKGGNPIATGEAWGGGVVPDVFRWCPTNPRLFALSTSSPNASTMGGGAIQLYYTSFPQSPRTVRLPLDISQSRMRVHDIEWQPICTAGDVLCVAVGRQLVWVQVGKKESQINRPEFGHVHQPQLI
ncbi:hypothetical protein CROQUDRAFT_655926 [Cronartium quercuum f. sp. fusiforme G11]|uniref:Uncharacterized protein n=1 Tax=Cronartium quercuum f. sp. fusiforme G11 TaxID=708437 RepID=A0A9P6NNY5_9BASI|nr:hypothetical protein CROQUDRAFT_655926 [Cronartium quercuum f. sp. fusiforme G11]